MEFDECPLDVLNRWDSSRGVMVLVLQERSCYCIHILSVIITDSYDKHHESWTMTVQSIRPKVVELAPHSFKRFPGQAVFLGSNVSNF